MKFQVRPRAPVTRAATRLSNSTDPSEKQYNSRKPLPLPENTQSGTRSRPVARIIDDDQPKEEKKEQSSHLTNRDRRRINYFILVTLHFIHKVRELSPWSSSYLKHFRSAFTKGLTMLHTILVQPPPIGMIFKRSRIPSQSSWSTINIPQDPI